MKLSVPTLLKWYLLAMAAISVIALATVPFTLARMREHRERLAAHPYVKARAAEGYRLVEDCGTWRRGWKARLAVVCLEKPVPGETDSLGRPAALREALVEDTRDAACPLRVVSPTDTTCLAAVRPGS